MIKDFLRYIYYHFIEVDVIKGSALNYKFWAFKRMIRVILYGKTKNQTYLFNEEITIKNNFGNFFIPKNSDFILTVSSKSEANMTKYFKLRENAEYFLDIGANAGKYSVIMGKNNANCKVLCFEPSPFTYNVLCKNLILNNLLKDNKVQAFNVGLSENNDILKFGKSERFTGLNKILSTQDVMMFQNEEFEIIEVKVNTLDFYLDNLSVDVKKVGLIKIDVEGHEFSVLKGSINCLASLEKNTNIIIEIHPNNTNKKEIFGLFNKYNFLDFQIDLENFIFIKQ